MRLDYLDNQMEIGPGGCIPQGTYDVPAPAPTDPWDFGDLPVFDGLDWEDQQRTPYDPTGAARNAGGAGGGGAGPGPTTGIVGAEPGPNTTNNDWYFG
ncbi:MAG: hypothetical protein AB7P00_42325 [Sandaracinaceae bacterium]